MPSQTYSSPGTYSFGLPGNAYNIRVVVRGARGGKGGKDAGADGGDGGTTTQQNFTLKQDFTARSITAYVGRRGENGEGNSGNASGGSGGSGIGGSGGRGGNAGDPPYSGGGGGGGGASGLAINGGYVICMGGSGGGGGASQSEPGQGGSNAGSASGTGSVTPNSGGGGADPGSTDGGGGGGGGGGDNGGGGGRGGIDKERRSGGGGAGGSTYNTSLVNSGSAAGGQGSRDGYVSVTWDLLPPPTISSFTASPNPQTSGLDGIPNYNTRLEWSISGTVTSQSLTSSAGETWTYGPGTRAQNITNLPQSSGSGATRSYLLAVGNQAGTVTAPLTVTVYNDRNPSNSWTTTFSNLEPSTSYAKKLGTLSGIDMTIKVSCPTSGVFFGTSATGSFSNPQYFTNGQNVYIKMNSSAFNTDVSGLSSSATFGKTNTRTVSVTVGGLSAFNVSYTTRAPRIKETFDYDGNGGAYPYEDIDLISNSPTSTLVTQTLNMNNIEIPMEIKGDNPNLQIKINNTSWKNIRQI